MSFGRPGALGDSFKVTPPQRGSFPLDHDGDCKHAMIQYMSCLKANANDAGSCRPESRAYLECRMDNGLMTRDDFQNLGLGDVQSAADRPAAATTVPASTTTTAAAAAAPQQQGTETKGGWFGSSKAGDKRLV